MAVITETNKEPNKAVQKLFIVKPSINDAANINNPAFITNMNKPRVSIVIGKVNTTNTGLTSRFKSPKIKAAISAT